MSGRGAPDVIDGFLEVQLATDTEHTVGAGEGVADQRLCFLGLTSLYYLRTLYTKGLEPVRLVLLTSFRPHLNLTQATN